jgi:hypothetical protein
MGEGAVRELKKGVGRQMLRSGCPKRLLDDCIIIEVYVRSHTSLDIYGLEGQVPESKIKGETVDISTISEYAWYEWVKFRDTAAKLPVSKIQLGRDLGAASDWNCNDTQNPEAKWNCYVQIISQISHPR